MYKSVKTTPIPKISGLRKNYGALLKTVSKLSHFIYFKFSKQTLFDSVQFLNFHCITSLVQPSVTYYLFTVSKLCAVRPFFDYLSARIYLREKCQGGFYYTIV